MDRAIETEVIKVAPVISTGIYASGDNIGGLLTISAATKDCRSGVIEAVTIADRDKEDAPIDIIFFDANPTATTFTDNDAQVLHDTDLFRIIGVVKLLAASYSDFTLSSVVSSQNINFPFKLSGSSILYACLVVRGTPTYTATTDLQLSVVIRQDS